MESHDSVWDAHPGRDRRFALLSWSFEWLKMEDNIELYVKTCFVCQRDKVERRVEAGPLPSGVCQYERQHGNMVEWVCNP